MDMLSGAKPPTADVGKGESGWGEVKEGGLKWCKCKLVNLGDMDIHRVGRNKGG